MKITTITRTMTADYQTVFEYAVRLRKTYLALMLDILIFYITLYSVENCMTFQMLKL